MPGRIRNEKFVWAAGEAEVTPNEGGEVLVDLDEFFSGETGKALIAKEGARLGKRYKLPDFLKGKTTQEIYERWLRRKAAAHVRRDRRRGNVAAIGEIYRLAIHEAVEKSDGRDAYTGEPLDWGLLSQYDNLESEENGREYKHGFALLPTVDHVGDGSDKVPEFRICSWRTNDAKNDLGLDDLIAFCVTFLRHQGYTVGRPE